MADVVSVVQWLMTLHAYICWDIYWEMIAIIVKTLTLIVSSMHNHICLSKEVIFFTSYS